MQEFNTVRTEFFYQASGCHDAVGSHYICNNTNLGISLAIILFQRSLLLLVIIFGVSPQINLFLIILLFKRYVIVSGILPLHKPFFDYFLGNFVSYFFR